MKKQVIYGYLRSFPDILGTVYEDKDGLYSVEISSARKCEEKSGFDSIIEAALFVQQTAQKMSR